MKYWTCKRAPQHAAEALECLGGNGFVEESAMPRLFRQSPVNGVWEGSGNVICLDVLRALAREPDTLEAYWSEVDRAGAQTHVWPGPSTISMSTWPTSGPSIPGPDSVVERMALVFRIPARSVRSSAVADAFCGSRLREGGAGAFGTLSTVAAITALLDRNTPALP